MAGRCNAKYCGSRCWLVLFVVNERKRLGDWQVCKIACSLAVGKDGGLVLGDSPTLGGE